MFQNIKISLLLIVAIYLSTLLIPRNLFPLELPSQEQLDHQPNTFMRDVNYYQYDEDGLLHSHLTTTLITHFSYQDSSQFYSPHYLIYTDRRVPWTITATFGKSQHGTQWIYLWDHVKIHEILQSTGPKTTIMTSTLTIFPNLSFAKTNDPVVITRPNALIHAIGMTANLKKGIFYLLSHSQGVYESSPSEKKNS